MSEISFEFQVDHRPEKTYQIIHDKLPRIIEGISIVHHTERVSLSGKQGDIFEDHWRINLLETIPNFISSLLDLEDVKIQSESHWNEAERRIDFELEAKNWEYLLESCEGNIQLVNSDSDTQIKVYCYYNIELSQITGLPGFVATRLSKKLDSLAETKVRDFIPDIKNGISGLES